MIEKLAENLINLKKEFASEYDGSSQIQEFLPLSSSDLFPINESELNLLTLISANVIPKKPTTKDKIGSSCK